MALVEKSKNSKVKIRNNKTKTMGIYGIVVAVFLMGLIGVISYVNVYKKEVQVVSFSENVVDRQLVEEVLLKPMSISEKDMKDGMVKWEDRKKYIGKYTAHYIKSNTPVYKDMFAEEPVLRTAYLYNLNTDEELLTFPYDIADAGGKLVTPGERLRIRGSYKVGDNTDDIESQIIFDVVEVQDLLNADNESIVDIIADANKLPQKDRETLMESADFIQKVTPKAILMVVKTRDIDKYVQFQAQENPKYTITILTRNEKLQSQDLNTGNSLLHLLDTANKSKAQEGQANADAQDAAVSETSN